jgi:hypothetical protein
MGKETTPEWKVSEEVEDELTSDELIILRHLGYQTGVAKKDTIDEAVNYFTQITQDDPAAIVGLSVLLNTVLFQIVKDFTVELKPERVKESDEQ